MKHRALIIDDERLARKEMRRLLAEFDEISIAGEAETLSEAVQLIESHRPDLIFLDIQLAGETGFDLLEQVDRTFKVIFVTAFDAFAVRAFEVNAIDYLLKPVNPDRLAKAIDRLSQESTSSTSLPPFEFDDRVFLEQGTKSIFLKVGQIAYIMAAGDYSEIYTGDGRTFMPEKSLREWEARLPEKHFLRIHRQTIVNLNEIEHPEPWFNRTFQVRLKGSGTMLAVSRRYAVKLKNKFS